MGRPREHGDQTRDALLSAAAAVLHSEGPAAISVRRVADEAGTSTRAVYSLFGDKSGLLTALAHEAAEIMRRHHEAVPEEDDPVDELPGLVLAYRAAALERPHLYGIYLGEGVDLDHDTQALYYRSFDRVLRTLRRAAASGRLGGHDPVDVGRHLWALVHGLASLELKGFLGDPARARQLWLESLAATLRGYADSPVRRERHNDAHDRRGAAARTS
ncbi:MAG: TetR/AcrR family transcriptional regulator [Hamadaea sp.]|uniref:TetR/AcrR family transcriptional regulator n=1 Tax=Hamadaea sp. TaxID=2024425 RepID=UPI00178FD556|nr:TetR/AcrR family transcriptional regulator [Hamadaea sp.]NUR69462.1 TetR/AcrR family transcriptional regulator [Hamadaea sp.]NUT23375.1 TetR/AcrR family transcriptional regulator [Hamadaea sp.]